MFLNNINPIRAKKKNNTEFALYLPVFNMLVPTKRRCFYEVSLHLIYVCIFCLC